MGSTPTEDGDDDSTEPGRPLNARQLELRALSNLALTLQAVAIRLGGVVSELERARGGVGITDSVRIALAGDLRRLRDQVGATAACLDPHGEPAAAAP